MTNRKPAICFLSLIVAVGFMIPNVAVQAQQPVEIRLNAKNGNDGGRRCVDGDVYRTLGKARTCAMAKINAGIPTQLTIAPGKYREQLTLVGTNSPSTASLRIVAAVPRSVVISGSVDRSSAAEFRPVNDNRGLYEIDYERARGCVAETINDSNGRYDICSNPKHVLSGYSDLLFLDGIRARQVLDENLLVTATPANNESGLYYVDAAKKRILVKPKSATPSLVEVGARDLLLYVQDLNDVEISGLIFEHATTPWANGRAAAVVNRASKLRIDNSVFSRNNGVGLNISRSSNVTVSRSVMNANGKDGINTFQAQNIVIRDSSTNYNNWRGRLTDYKVWWLGNKITYTNSMRIENHTSIGNYSTGLWLDLDNRNIRIINPVIRGNARNGLYLEASPGPISVEGGDIRDNWEHGIKGALVENVSIHATTITNNGIANRRLASDSALKNSEVFVAFDQGYKTGRTLTNWQTGQPYQVALKNWTINAASMSNSQPDRRVDTPLINVFLPDDISPEGYGKSWRKLFFDTLTAESNRYSHASTSAAFTIDGSNVSFCNWKTASANDRLSTFNGADPCTDDARVSCTDDPPLVNGYIVENGKWSATPQYRLARTLVGESTSPGDLSASFRAFHDRQRLYLLVQVSDSSFRSDSTSRWYDDDSIEIYIDGDNSRLPQYDQVNDFQIAFKRIADTSQVAATATGKPLPAGINAAVGVQRGSYLLELSIPLASLGIVNSNNFQFGLDVHVNDDDNGGARDTKLAWHAQVDNSWRQPSLFGQGRLQNCQ